MARPRTKSDDEILQAARACFLESGPGVSTQTIADQVGLSQPALFKRFGSKQELLLRALMPPAEPAWLAQVRAGVDARPIQEQLVDIALAASRYFVEMTPAMMMLRASGIEPADLLNRYEVPPPARAMALLTQWFQQAIDAGRIRRVQANELAVTFIGAIHGRCFLQHIAGASLPSESIEDSIRAHCEVLCLGMGLEERVT